jgi:DNA/RNA-binding domain of Phe-tRNA-synthetase-like protein
MIEIDAHPLLDARVVALSWPSAIGEIDGAPAVDPLLASPDRALPDRSEPHLAAERDAVRALLRFGGFKPAGRSKPCSEYIVGVHARGDFPRINAAVDLTNALVLRGGLPISTVDRDRLALPLRVGIAPPQARYVFNLSGQEIDLAGLLCLFDAAGPCANAVKDAQRAKTSPDTRRTITIIWGTTAIPGRAARVADRLVALAASLGAVVG